MTHAFALALAALASGPVQDDDVAPPAVVDWTTPVELAVPFAPSPVSSRDKRILVYEVEVTNMTADVMRLDRLDVFGGGDEPIETYEGRGLNSILLRIGPSVKVKERRDLGAGLTAAFYVFLELEPNEVPMRLRHRLHATRIQVKRERKSEGDDGAEAETTETPILIEDRGVGLGPAPVVIGPPLRGGTWLCLNGPANSSNHRRARITVEGRTTIPQRYGIDFIQLDSEHDMTSGPENEKFVGYGAEVIAVADGVVVGMLDGLPENTEGPASRAVEIDRETVAGNHVLLDIGDRRTCLYAHFQPGSVTVEVGQEVKRGDVLGLLGNSGNSTAPHLHFHLGDSHAKLAVEGIPYVFDSYRLLTKEDVATVTADNDVGDARTNELPRNQDRVWFAQ